MESEKSERPLGKSLKVAMFCLGADEAVVAKLPKRAGLITLQAKGFT